MKVVFIVASLSQPRCIKRIKALYENGYDVEVYGYRRGLYEVNAYPNEIKVNELGYVDNGKGYVKRFINNYKKIKKIVKSYSSNTLFYGFSYDIALSLLLNKRKYVYEISDIIYAYYNNSVLRRFFKFIDKIMIKCSVFTIMTSEGFKRYFFSDSEINNVIVQPNKVSCQLENIDRKSKDFEKKITFAYVGSFRYPNTIFRFARIIGEYFPQYEYHFYGNSDLTPLAKELARKYSNVKYLGVFKSPDDLQNIYANIDVVTACYDNSGLNEQIAEPNKLYEAICFCCPVIVSENTFLSQRVNQLKVGYVINPNEDKFIIDFISNLKKEDLKNISINEYRMSKEEYIDSPKIILDRLNRFKL